MCPLCEHKEREREGGREANQNFLKMPAVRSLQVSKQKGLGRQIDVRSAKNREIMLLVNAWVFSSYLENWNTAPHNTVPVSEGKIINDQNVTGRAHLPELKMPLQT